MSADMMRTINNYSLIFILYTDSLNEIVNVNLKSGV